MGVPQPTIFLSYRRPFNFSTARAIFMDLHQHGYDVFMDTESINNERFETIILAEIAAREHFLVVLTPSTLEGCQEPDDWLRREIEYAMELQRNIVPIMVNDFRFDDTAFTYLTGRLRDLSRYNGLPLSQDFFDAAMERLRTRFLKLPVLGNITPAPPQNAPGVETKIVQVFLCHASEDKPQVREIYHQLKAAGFTPWLDEIDILPGENWNYEIDQALENSDFVLVFLSTRSVKKIGYVQREFKRALERSEEMPEGFIHTIPVKLDDCTAPRQFRHHQWAKLYEEGAFDTVVKALRHGLQQREQPVPQPLTYNPSRQDTFNRVHPD
jgi:TIR domain